MGAVTETDLLCKTNKVLTAEREDGVGFSGRDNVNHVGSVTRQPSWS